MRLLFLFSALAALALAQDGNGNQCGIFFADCAAIGAGQFAIVSLKATQVDTRTAHSATGEHDSGGHQIQRRHSVLHNVSRQYLPATGIY